MKTRHIDDRADGVQASWGLHSRLHCHVRNACFIVKRRTKIYTALRIDIESCILQYSQPKTRPPNTVNFLFFSLSHLLSLSYCSSSLPFVIQIRGHIAGTPPPSSPRFMRRVWCFLPSSTRVELCVQVLLFLRFSGAFCS